MMKMKVEERQKYAGNNIIEILEGINEEMN